MSRENPKFHLMTNIYLAITSAVIVLLPVEYVAIQSRRHMVSTSQWHIAIYAVAILIALLLYTSKRCASHELTYLQGLQFVAAYMDTGWLYSAFFLILFSLVLVFPASIVISVYGDLTGGRKLTPHRYYKLIYTFYKHRTHQ